MTEEEAKIGRVMAAAKRAGDAVFVGWNRQTGGEVSDELLAMIVQATSNAIFRCLAAGSLREDEIAALTDALQLTIIDKQDALARAAAENQKLRDELDGKRESWYTRYEVAENRATKAEEGLREAVTALKTMLQIWERHCGLWIERDRVLACSAALARIKELLPP